MLILLLLFSQTSIILYLSVRLSNINLPRSYPFTMTYNFVRTNSYMKLSIVEGERKYDSEWKNEDNYEGA